MTNIEKHKRVNDIFLGPLERPALQWLSAHMPAWITPDICTAIGVLGALVTSIGYILSNIDRNYLWLASFGFVVNWFGDSLDGTLARYRHIERPKFGFFIDHTTDSFSQVVIFLGLGLSPYVSFNVACLALIAYLMLSVLAYVRTCVVGEFKASWVPQKFVCWLFCSIQLCTLLGKNGSKIRSRRFNWILVFTISLFLRLLCYCLVSFSIRPGCKRVRFPVWGNSALCIDLNNNP